MPRYNGRGPLGQGPGTGRGLGPCGGGMAYGRGGAGRGLGWRRFWGNRFGFNPTEEEESEILSEEAGFLENELKAIKSRLGQLKGSKK